MVFMLKKLKINNNQQEGKTTMKKHFAIASLTLLLSGCVSTYQTYDPMGKPATFIQCPLAQPRLCYHKAEELCPAGYAVIAQEGSLNLFDSNRSITVTCKKKRDN